MIRTAQRASSVAHPAPVGHQPLEKKRRNNDPLHIVDKEKRRKKENSHPANRVSCLQHACSLCAAPAST
eukprot:3940432-Rhodomonas_salina.1